MLLSFQNWVTVMPLSMAFLNVLSKNCNWLKTPLLDRLPAPGNMTILIQLHWLPITQRIWFKVLLLTFKAIHKLSPAYLQELTAKCSPSHKLRSSDAMLLERRSYNLKTYSSRAFRMAASVLWNNLPRETKLYDDIDNFKKKLKTYLLNIASI